MKFVLVGTLAVLAAGVVQGEGEMTSIPAARYAQDGLVLHYDGIENAGAGVHNAAATKWVNLAGALDGTCDVTLPNWVAVGSNWMYSAVISGLSGNGGAINSSKSTAPSLAAVPGITAATPVTTLEVVMQRDATWTYTDNYYNTQVAFSTPRGNISYRANGTAWTNDFNVIYPISATTTDMAYWNPDADARKVHTLTAQLGIGANGAWLDGVSSWVDWGGTYKSAWGTTYRLFSNTRVGLRIYAIRLYNRALTAEEIALHAKLDRTRFLGAAADSSLKFIVPNIPAQTLNGAEDACPDPEVWDAATNRRLVRAVDYRLSYYENDRPGTGVLIVTGLGDYAAYRARRVFTITHGFTAAIADSGRGALGATVTFPAADEARALYAAWGETDGGPLTNGWPQANFAKVADVPALATSAEVTLPAGATAAPALRFFLEHPATPRAYVVDGLRACYDGVYNAGTFAAPLHDNASTNLLDLSGHANDLWLPPYVTVQDNALYSAVRTDPATGNKTADKAGTYPQFSALNGLGASPYELTLESVTKRANTWTFTDNYGNLQSVAYTPLGYICYREQSSAGLGICYLGWNAGAGAYTATYNSWFPSSVDVRQPHTLSARLSRGSWNASFGIDGTVRTGWSVECFFQDSASPKDYRFFLNPRADVTAYSIRLYLRRLSDLELKRNALVDAARFRGGNGKILAASALVRSGRLASRTAGSGAVVRVTAAPCARALYAAWDTADRGDDTNAWAHVAYIATVPAGVTELASVALPAEARRSHFGRLFLVDVYDSTSYITNGLAAHWDGIDNVLVDGVRGHDDATRTWYDLTGGGANVTLPSYVSVEANALYSTNHVGQSPAAVTVTGVTSNSAALTLETVAKHCGFQKWDDLFNLQTPCSTPLGTIGFRKNQSNGLFCYTPGGNNKNDLRNWTPAGANVREINTLAISLALEGSELWLNAARGDNQPYDNYSSSRTDVCTFFGAQRIGLRMYGVRIYTRHLSKEELAWNAGVDAVRYKGAPAPMRASSPIDFRESGSLFIIR